MDQERDTRGDGDISITCKISTSATTSANIAINSAWKKEKYEERNEEFSRATHVRMKEKEGEHAEHPQY